MAGSHITFEIRGWLKADPKHYLAEIVSMPTVFLENVVYLPNEEKHLYKVSPEIYLNDEIERFKARWPGLIEKITLEPWK